MVVQAVAELVGQLELVGCPLAHCGTEVSHERLQSLNLADSILDLEAGTVS